MNKFSQEFKSRLLAYVGGGLGLVAGLAWNEAIQELIKLLFPLDRNSVAAKFLYALIMTFVLVILVSYLERLLKPKEDRCAS